MQVLQATMLTAVPKIQFLKLENELCPQQRVNHWQHGNRNFPVLLSEQQVWFFPEFIPVLTCSAHQPTATRNGH